MQRDGKLDRKSIDYQVLLRTVYAEARREPERTQRAIAWVVKNRATANRPCWGGPSLADVCKKPGEFECWNGCYEIDMRETELRRAIELWLPGVYLTPDPSRGSDHYLNVNKGYPAWTLQCRSIIKLGKFQFYKYIEPDKPLASPTKPKICLF